MHDLPRGRQAHSRASAPPAFDFIVDRKVPIPNWQSDPLLAKTPVKPYYLRELRPRNRDYDYRDCLPDIWDLLKRLKGVEQPDPNVPQWRAHCPAHTDNNPSFSLAIGSNGKLLTHCFGGCSPEDVQRALGHPPLCGYRWPTQSVCETLNCSQNAKHSESSELATTRTWPELAALLRKSPLQNAPDAAADWAKLLAEFQANDDEGLIERTAQNLGIDLWALQSIGVGFDPVQIALIFPESDGQGRVVGLATRQGDGRKLMLPKSHRGLYLSADSLESTMPLYCCEGPTDTAALLTMGLPAVGRPSALGGIEYLIELLGAMPHDREIIILGENDEKSDGRWPGRDAAIKLTDTIGHRLGRAVKAMLPPDGVKDVREWLLQQRESQDLEVSE